MITVFIDGPIAGDVRTDFPPALVIKIPIPRRITYCDCNPAGPMSTELSAEIVRYNLISSGPRVAIYSSASDATETELVNRLKNWQVTDLGNPLWERHCRDRRAFM